MSDSQAPHKTNPEKVRLSGWLSLKAGRSAEYRGRFVKAGRIKHADQSLSKVSISPQALEEAAAAGLFDDKAVFINHASWLNGPDLEKLAGVTLESRYDPGQQAITGTIRLNDTPSGRLAHQLISDLLDSDHAPDVGLSIVFFPLYEDPQDSDLITGMRHVESVDFVFSPAAEGRIFEALSTLRGSASSPPVPSAARDGKLPAYYLNTTGETIMTHETTHPNSSQVEGPLQEQSAWLEAARESATRQMLNASSLPPIARARLAEMSFNTPDDLSAAIQAEQAYLAGLVQDHIIQIGGTPPRQPQISGMRDSIDRIKIALDALLAGVTPRDVAPLTGIRELYHILSGDYDLTGMFHAERVSLASVTSSTMANLVADALNKRVMNEFQNYPHWWDPIVLIEDFTSLQQVKWVSLGGVGELPTVAEGAAYTEMTWDDSKETSDFVKKGGYLGITLEAIDKDDTGRVRAAPRAIAQAAWLTLSKAVSAIFTSNSGTGPTMSDSNALFDASNHGNLSTTALSLTQWNAIRTAMRKQTEIHSGERLGALTAPRYLLVPPDLEMTALQILASEYEYTYALSNGVAAPVNPSIEGNAVMERLSSARERVIVVDLWTDTNNYACAADPRLYPTIGLAYRYGRTPEIFSVASPTAGLMFTNDTMPVKVRYFYAVGPIDWRGLYKGNVA